MKSSKYIFIGWRQIFTKGKKNISHFLSIITSLSIIFCTLSIVLALSAFNGIKALIEYNIDENLPDISIYPTKGNNLVISDEQLQKLQGVKHVEKVGYIINSKGLLDNKNNQITCKILGIDSNSYTILNYPNRIYSAMDLSTFFNNKSFFLLSNDAKQALGYSEENYLNYINIYIQKKIVTRSYDIKNHFYSYNILPEGYFYSVKDLDDVSVVCNINWLNSITSNNQKGISCAIISLKNRSLGDEDVKKDIYNILGKDILIKTKEDVNEITIKVLKSEKLFITLLFGFIFILSSFSFGGLIAIVILMKKHNFKILFALGLRLYQIKKIFITYSFMLVSISSIIGIGMSYLIVYLQIKYKLITLNSDIFGIDYYPIVLKKQEAMVVFASVIILFSFISYLFINRIKLEAKTNTNI